MHLQPIILLAFNDDFGGNQLRDISLEKKAINQALSPAETQKLCKLVQIDAAEGKDIFDQFRMYRDMIRIFHFGGHANSFQLKTRETTLEEQSLAQFLVHQKGVELVFLNACSTFEQAKALIESGVKLVIATHERVNDTWARKFAAEFYQSLAKGLDIQDAFEEAKTIVVAESGSNDRGLFWDEPTDVLADQYPWTLITKDDIESSWSLFNLRDIRFTLKFYQKVLQEFETLYHQFPNVPISVTDTDFQWLKQWIKTHTNSLIGVPDRPKMMKVKRELVSQKEKINQLQVANQTLIRELLNREVEKINYTNEKIYFDQYLLQHDEPIGIFVIHGLRNFGHSWLMKRLLLKRNMIQSKVIVVDRVVSRRRQKNWFHIFLGDIASQLFKRDANDIAVMEELQRSADIQDKVERITQRICQRLENGETIVFRINNFIYDIPVDDADAFLSDLVNTFWHKTYPRLKESAQLGEGQLLFFLLERTEESILSDLTAYLELTPEASANRKAPLILDIQKIKDQDLVGWYTSQIMNVPIMKVRKQLIHLSDPEACKRFILNARETHIGIFQQIYACCETTFEEVDDF